MTPLASPVDPNALYRSEYHRLMGYFVPRVGRDEAADLVQEVFVRLMRRGPLIAIENPQAYLTRIAQNLLIDRTRQKCRNNVVLCPIDDDSEPAIEAEQTWQLEATDLLRTYSRSVGAMTPKTRRVFLMHRHRGLSYRQIADQLSLSVPAVEYHMIKALKQCRSMIGSI